MLNRPKSVWRRGRPAAVAATLCGAAVIMACGGSTSNANESKAAGASATARPNPSAQTATGLQPVIASSELVVGPNRFTMGVLDRTGTPIPDAKVHLRFFRLIAATPTARTAVAARQADGA